MGTPITLGVHMLGAEPLWSRDFRLIWASQIVIVTVYFGVMSVLPVFFVDELRLDGMLMGIVTALYVAAAVISRPLSGYFLDRKGRKFIYTPSYLFFAAAFLLYPFIGSLAALILLRLLHGTLWGTLMGSANTYAVDLIPPKRRGEGIGIFGLTMNLGQALGPAIAVTLVAVFGYDFLFFGGGIVALLGFLLVLRLREPAIVLEKKPFALGTLLERTSLPTALVIFFASFPIGVMTNYAVLYSTKELLTDAGAFFLLLAAGMASARLVSGKIFDRSGPGKAMAWAFVLLLGGLLLKALTRDILPFYGSGFFMGVGAGTILPVCQTMINNLAPPQRRGAANATCLTAFDCGICVGILVVGYVQEAFGWSVSHFIEICFVLVAMATFWGLSLPHYNRSRRQPE